jgi:anti-anti-sigma factor
MTAKPFEVQVRHQQPHVAVVELHSEITGTAEASLNAAYTEATSQGAATILLNFADVNYINSTGIALIVGLLGQARAARLNLIACGLIERYIEIFRITRLVDFLTIFPDEASALKQIGG